MTNQILFPSSTSTTTVDTMLASAKNNSTSEETDFQKLFSTMLSSSNVLLGMDSTGSTDLTPILLLLFTQLFGENLLTEDPGFSADTPQGKPLNGIMTQGCHDGHVAIDFGVPVGTNVQSTMEGKVVYAGWNNEGYGNLVIVENGAYRTYYAHLSSIPVKVGQVVEEGDVIGLSGNTGNSTGPHLHYEIRKNGVAIDPTTTLKV